MQLVKTFGSSVHGVNAFTVTIEVNVSVSGAGADIKYFMVGLPDNSIRESWHRIESAVKENHFNMPRTKIVVNLSPADVRKEGTHYDLPIAIGVLGSSLQMPSHHFHEYVILGELSLDGSIKPIKSPTLCANKVSYKTN